MKRNFRYRHLVLQTVEPWHNRVLIGSCGWQGERCDARVYVVHHHQTAQPSILSWDQCQDFHHRLYCHYAGSGGSAAWYVLNQQFWVEQNPLTLTFHMFCLPLEILSLCPKTCSGANPHSRQCSLTIGINRKCL